MYAPRTTFALRHDNHGYIPVPLIADARAELPRALAAMGLRHFTSVTPGRVVVPARGAPIRCLGSEAAVPHDERTIS